MYIQLFFFSIAPAINLNSEKIIEFRQPKNDSITNYKLISTTVTNKKNQPTITRLILRYEILNIIISSYIYMHICIHILHV